jgi:hypothetical protein
MKTSVKNYRGNTALFCTACGSGATEGFLTTVSAGHARQFTCTALEGPAAKINLES